MFVIIVVSGSTIGSHNRRPIEGSSEDADRGKTLKDVAVATIKDKGKAAEAAEKRAQESDRARVLAKQKLTKMDIKLGGQSSS